MPLCRSDQVISPHSPRAQTAPASSKASPTAKTRGTGRETGEFQCLQQPRNEIFISYSYKEDFLMIMNIKSKADEKSNSKKLQAKLKESPFSEWATRRARHS